MKRIFSFLFALLFTSVTVSAQNDVCYNTGSCYRFSDNNYHNIYNVIRKGFANLTHVSSNDTCYYTGMCYTFTDNNSHNLYNVLKKGFADLSHLSSADTSAWHRSGDATTAGRKLGTTTNQTFSLVTNNTVRLVFKKTGNVLCKSIDFEDNLGRTTWQPTLRAFLYTNGAAVVDYFAQELSDTNSAISLDWNIRRAYDSNANLKLDWGEDGIRAVGTSTTVGANTFLLNNGNNDEQIRVFGNNVIYLNKGAYIFGNGGAASIGGSGSGTNGQLTFNSSAGVQCLNLQSVGTSIFFDSQDLWVRNNGGTLQAFKEGTTGNFVLGNSTSPLERLHVIGNVYLTGTITDGADASIDANNRFLYNAAGNSYVRYNRTWTIIHGASDDIDLSGPFGGNFRIGGDPDGTAGNGLYLKSFQGGGGGWRNMISFLNTASAAPTIDLLPDNVGGITVKGLTGASGTFTTVDLKTVTVTNGIITAITP